MRTAYAEWSTEYLTRFKESAHCLGLCKEAVNEMAAAFPELTRVPGHVYSVWGKRAHWWLTAPDGTIVDPTRAQYPGPITYEPFKEGDEVRLGRCMECGAEIWGTNPEAVYSTCLCNETCERNYAAYLEG